MKKFKFMVQDRLEELAKILFVLVLFLSLGIVFLIFTRGEKDNLTEESLFDELLVESEEESDSIQELKGIEKVSAEETEVIKTEQILVDLKGAIQSPGVYQMERDDRVIDCVNEAGGFLADAEQKAVNLAQRLEDQMVIYIPIKGEELVEIEQIVGEPSENTSVTSDHPKIDLNKATKEELKTLNGIGDVKAENIIAYRETKGYFQKIEDITNVSGIGDATFEKLKDELSVSP